MKAEKYRIGIVNSSTFGRYFPDLMERLAKIGEVERIEVDPDIKGEKLADRLSGFQFIIASVTPNFSRDFFAFNDDVILIARHGIGYNNVDVKAATEKGVAVTRVLGIHERDAVAELTISLAMICLRQIVPATQAVRDGKWDKRKGFVGRELSKMKVGIIGYGNIGSRVAEIIKEGFGAEVYAYDPNVSDAIIEKNGIRPSSFNEILKESDLLSFNASLNPGNYHFIGKDEFKLMKDGVIIINTARGELIKEAELAEAVKSGKVAAVGLDVSEREPIEPDNPLLGLENVYIVPHIGGYTEYSLRKMDEKMVEDIEAIVRGKIPDQLVNPEVLN